MGGCPRCGALAEADWPGRVCPACAFAAAEAEATGDAAEEPLNLEDIPLTGRFAKERPGQVTGKAADRIGRYKLIEPIGEGGFGVVYLAEQEHPVRRQVALKVIKLGLDTHSVVARFEAERQALALMDHPNIAKVFDGGATETGLPFFVMELVRGVPITVYCDRNNLSTPARLQLFRQVCLAIQHAHQKGIIHRDIKPSNIIVTVQDGVPVPKVIDFGIAKATQNHVTGDKGAQTAFAQFMGTPAYMSPEQAGMGRLDIDTRSDVYSLGVLLYELLTGKTPFDTTDLIQAGFEEMRRIIREKEPLRPSTLVGTFGLEDRTKMARAHASEPLSLIRVMRGDLDWIVMKCLEKDRSRRYATANGLAVDIQRHLADEPVAARAPTLVYRLGKGFRRHKLVFSAAGTVFLALAAGLGISLWSLRNAHREASRSQQIAQFLRDMLDGVGPSAARGRDTAMLGEILDKTAKRLEKGLTNQRDVEADLRTTIGSVYLDLAQYTNAEVMFQAALALRTNFMGARSANLASSFDDLGRLRWKEGKLQEAEDLFRKALTLRKQQRRHRLADKANSLNGLANVLNDEGKFAEAAVLYREALAIKEKVLGSEHPDVATFLNNLAEALRYEGKLDEAEAFHRRALAMRRRLLGGEHPDVAASLDNLANLLEDRGNHVEAEELHRQALAMRRKLFGSEHPDVATSLSNLAEVLRAEGRLAEAETLHREALAMRQHLLGSEHPDVLDSVNNLAATLSDEGNFKQAEPLYRDALALRKKVAGDDNPSVAMAMSNLAEGLRDEGRFDEAAALHRQALAMRKKLLGEEHPKVALSLEHLAGTLRNLDKLDEAAALSRQALAIRRKRSPGGDADLAGALALLAQVLADQGHLDQAEGMQRQALDMQRKTQGNQNPEVGGALADLARTLLFEKRFVEAEPVARECVTILEKLPPDGWETFSARALLGSSLRGQRRYAEAETLLLSGCTGLKLLYSKIPAQEKRLYKEGLRSLIQLYQETHQSEKAANWERDLKQLNE